MKRLITLCALIITVYSKQYAQNMGIKLAAATSPNTTLDVNGSLAFREGTALVLANGVNSNVALADYSLFRITGPTTAFSITGFTGGQDGRVLTIINATTQSLTLTHQATSTAANQINTGGSSLTLVTNGVATLIYNTTLTKWVVSGGQGFTSSTNWSLTGNSGTTAGTNFMGTTDAQDVVLKVNNTEGGRLSSTGFDVANHLSVGSGTSINTYRTADISEDYTTIPAQTTIGLRVSQIRTEAVPTSSSIFYGIDALATYRMSGSSSIGVGSGVKGTILTDGNYSFNSLMGGNFTAQTAGSSATQRQAIGVYGLSENNGTGTIGEAVGTYGDMTISGGGTVTLGAGASGWSYLNGSGTISTSSGFRGGSARTNASGTITTGIGAWVESYNAATNYGVLSSAYANLSGSYTNTYGGSFSAYGNHASATLTNTYGVNSSVYKVLGTMTNTYGGYFSAAGGATTNYGVYSTTGNTATNNYLYYGAVTGSTNTDWGLYITGEDKSYFSGNIGIGTTSPTDRVAIVSESSDDNLDDLSITTYSTSTTPSFTLFRSKGTAASPTTVGNSEYSAGFNVNVHDGTSFINATGINTVTASDFSSSKGSDLIFTTARSSSITEKMRLTSTGALCIGNTSPGTHKLHVTGTAGLSTGTSWTNTSDRRVKENIHGYQRGLKEILAINPVYYTYKANTGLGNGEENIGIIAQDVEKILPEAIMTSPIMLKDGSVIQDGKHLYRADAIWFAMINAFKEVNSDNEKLKSENTVLQSEVEKLKADLKKQATLTDNVLSRLEKLEETMAAKASTEAVKTKK